MDLAFWLENSVCVGFRFIVLFRNRSGKLPWMLWRVGGMLVYLGRHIRLYAVLPTPARPLFLCAPNRAAHGVLWCSRTCLA